MHSVNKIGQAFIKSQLREHVVTYLSEEPTDEAVAAYAAEVQESISTGQPQFEIRGPATASGTPVIVHLTDEMINWAPFDPTERDVSL